MKHHQDIVDVVLVDSLVVENLHLDFVPARHMVHFPVWSSTSTYCIEKSSSVNGLRSNIVRT